MGAHLQRDPDEPNAGRVERRLAQPRRGLGTRSENSSYADRSAHSTRRAAHTTPRPTRAAPKPWCPTKPRDLGCRTSCGRRLPARRPSLCRSRRRRSRRLQGTTPGVVSPTRTPGRLGSQVSRGRLRTGGLRCWPRGAWHEHLFEKCHTRSIVWRVMSSSTSSGEPRRADLGSPRCLPAAVAECG